MYKPNRGEVKAKRRGEVKRYTGPSVGRGRGSVILKHTQIREQGFKRMQSRFGLLSLFQMDSILFVWPDRLD